MDRTIKMNKLILALAFVFAGCSTQIHYAVRNGDTERVKELLDSGSDVNARDSSQESELFKGEKRLAFTPLHWASYLGDSEMVKLLISKGAELDAVDPSYGTSLHLAAEQAHLEVVELLLGEGAQVNLSSPSWGHTPLHRASWGPVVRRFGQDALDFGADPNPDYTAIAALLIAEGAELNAQDHEGETPLDQAIEGGSAETVALLKKHGAKTRKELKAEKPDSGGKFEDYYAAGLRIRFRESWLVTERDELPWKGYGVADGYPETVLQSLDVSDLSDTYSLPAGMVNDLGNPRIDQVEVRQRGKLLELSLINEDGEGGYHAFFQVDPLEYRARRFVKGANEEEHKQTHDWTSLRKR